MNTLKELKLFIILWLTQSLSALGSAMTNFALVIWLYNDSGSALTTAMLTICSYAPYVVMSIFAGAISDKWNKKAVMLVCDSFAAMCTVAVLVLLKTGSLQVWHLYVLNALNGLMNTVQQPASDVAVTMLTPKKHYQKTSGMRSFSNSLVTILTPVFATALTALAGVEAVIAFDLITFFTAFILLLLFIRIPEPERKDEKNESVFQTAKSGLCYLKANKGILWLILFLAAINFIASIYEAALPAMVLSKSSETVLGAVNACVGIAALAGSVIATLAPAPKSRVRVICNCLLFSMSTENFLLAFGDSPFVWCAGAVMGWIFIPLMNANMDVIFRTKIPAEMLGRVYSARNTLQFFTIPLGYFLGGLLVDRLFEPLMENTSSRLLTTLFGTGKGSGAAFLYFVIGIAGVAVCLIFRRIKHIRELK
ncbi:MAG: MFS transporter [Oscillospiraceae bacterium]